MNHKPRSEETGLFGLAAAAKEERSIKEC